MNELPVNLKLVIEQILRRIEQSQQIGFNLAYLLIILKFEPAISRVRPSSASRSIRKLSAALPLCGAAVAFREILAVGQLSRYSEVIERLETLEFDPDKLIIIRQQLNQATIACELITDLDDYGRASWLTFQEVFAELIIQWYSHQGAESSQTT